MQTIAFGDVPALFDSIGELFGQKKEELCDMDARLGDGDLGLTMSKGFGALPQTMRAAAPGVDGDVGKLLVKGGMTLSSVSPSTMGFLMASGLMEAGKALKGTTEITAQSMAKLLEAFAAGIQKRGKCQAGDCTILDAVLPAASKAAAAASEGASLKDVIEAARRGAADGVEATKEMAPKFGKATVHAAKALGVADQGAVAGYYLICGMANYICK